MGFFTVGVNSIFPIADLDFVYGRVSATRGGVTHNAWYHEASELWFHCVFEGEVEPEGYR
jgi:hypothetical protein